jgi:hypothetical protein
VFFYQLLLVLETHLHVPINHFLCPITSMLGVVKSSVKKMPFILILEAMRGESRTKWPRILILTRVRFQEEQRVKIPPFFKDPKGKLFELPQWITFRLRT